MPQKKSTELIPGDTIVVRDGTLTVRTATLRTGASQRNPGTKVTNMWITTEQGRELCVSPNFSYTLA